MVVGKVEGGAKKSTVKSTGKDASEGVPSAMPEEHANQLSELGEKIFLDRYALKDVAKETLSEGDTVVVCVDLKTGQREVGTARRIVNQTVTVELRDGTTVAPFAEPVRTSPGGRRRGLT